MTPNPNTPALAQPACSPIEVKCDSAGTTENELDFARQAIVAEARAVERVAGLLDENFLRGVDLIVQTIGREGSVIVSGMGKSGLIGQKISSTMASLGVPSQWIHPSEAAHGDLGRIHKADCLLALSYSGETDELVALAAILQQDGVPVISITTGAGDSSLERVSTVALGIGVVDEACPLSLAPTSSTTATLALGDALALAASRRQSFSADDFARRHPAGSLGDLLRPLVDVIRFRAGDNLPILRDDLTVSQALQQASTIGRRPGALILVNEHEQISGVFTDGDLRRLILRDPVQLEQPISQVMTRSPKTLPADAIVRDAVNLVRESRQDEIPLVDDDGKPVGLLDVQDLIALKVVRD